MINLKFKDIRMREKIISKFKYSCEQNENSCRFGNKIDLCAKKKGQDAGQDKIIVLYT